ncbi:hypothetical protein Q1695_008116 [Nippostrongylus brasiliensis]|nr:hypothetical protein Q1695_008116 [Nippostrongylus brasiliensis]
MTMYGHIERRLSGLFLLQKAYFHATSSTCSIGRYAKLQKRKDPLSSYPPEFRAKLKEWPKLLQAEIDESVAHLKELREVGDLLALEERGLLLAELRLASDTMHPITGRTVILKRVHSAEKPDRSKLFRAGAPVAVRDSKTLKEVAECVVLSSNRKEVKIKIRPSSESRHLDGDTEYVLTMSQSSGALHAVQDFFLQNKVVDTPGVDLLGYAFRAKNMPSIHNDRMIADLPNELNESQRRAISAALNKRRPFVAIQGPPGTGKTRVVAEIVRQLLRLKKKVLVCAPSHVAVDKVMTDVLSSLRGNEDEHEICEEEPRNDVVADAETIEDAIMSHEKYPDLCDIYANMNDRSDAGHRKELKTEANRLKWRIIKEAYKKRLVIFCTLTSSAIQRLPCVNWEPDVIIIDEAAQASEPVAWAAVVQAKRCILAGDQAQLPAVVTSKAAREGNLDVSLMQRLATEFSNANINQLLTVQYRMNEKIMQWSSTQFYDSRLVADDKVSDITLSEISFVPKGSELNNPLIMINTDVGEQGRHKCKEELFRMSYRNRGEAELVIRYLRLLEEIGVPGKEIAVISPYYAQVAQIREMMTSTDVSVNTVDSFQGQEREVVVFSMVRHNPEQVIGFLRDERRLNVAITRAKRQFVLIGSARMMKKDRHLRSLFETIKSTGKVYGPAIMNEFEREVGPLPTSSDRRIAEVQSVK